MDPDVGETVGLEQQRGEIVLVVSQRAPIVEPQGLDALIGMAGGLAQRVAAEVESLVAAAIGGILDRVVPVTAGAILDRIDLTTLVLQRVDLRRVVEQTLDRMDLTQLVLDRVDVDVVVSRADLNKVIDRLPLIDVANYIVDEIDLPSLIRESTGGIASDAMNAVRLQTSEIDTSIAHLIDRMLRRHRNRAINAPGTPESLQGEESDS